MLEKELQSAVERLMRQTGWLHYHTWRSDRSQPGFPDLVAVRGKRVLFVELKSEKGRMSPAQLNWFAALENAPGVEAYVWRPEHLDDIAKILSKTHTEGPPDGY